MAAYWIANFKVTNPARYKSYILVVIPTLKAHGAELLVAEYESKALEGEPHPATVVIKFESQKALDGWYNSPEYQQIMHLRTDNSEGVAVAAGEFDLEKNLRLLEAM